MTDNDCLRFVLREEHLLLIRRMRVQWLWYGGEPANAADGHGAPTVNPKRPYGNSFIHGDIAEILGLPYPEDPDDIEPEPIGLAYKRAELEYEAACKRLMDIHRETEMAVQLILSRPGELVPLGAYTRPAIWSPWVYDEPPTRAEVTDG